jgi:RNA polymerase sigma-70 factor, ECF subfamily
LRTREPPLAKAVVLDGSASSSVWMGGTDANQGEGRLKRILRAEFDVMWRLLRRLGVPERDVDDAIQEVIWVLARKIEQVEHGRERAFVLGTAYRVAATARRTLRRRRETDELPPEALIAFDEDPESLLAQRRARILLDQTLEALPIDVRSVFVLFELERFTMAEIAECLDLAPGTVASRLRRARALFAEAVARLEQRSTPGDLGQLGHEALESEKT